MLTPAPLSGSANGEGEPMDFAYSPKVEELRVWAAKEGIVTTRRE